MSDGTELAWEELGSGEPVLLVHGGLTDHTSWGPVLDELAGGATVCALDRRGRGLSGDANDGSWSLQREGVDVAEVMAALGCRKIVGHSFGALVVLQALPDLPQDTRAVLYEPPGPDRLHPVPGGLEKIVATYESGDLEGALRLFVVEELMLSERVYEAMAANPAFDTMRAGARTLPRELRSVAAGDLDRAHLSARNDVSVLLLVSESGGSPMFRAHAEELVPLLPDARIETVSGIPHLAMATDPTFSKRVADFLGLGGGASVSSPPDGAAPS